MSVDCSDLELLDVLIVDDNFYMRKLLRTILCALEVRNVAEAAGFNEVLDEMIQSDANVILTDLMMKPTSGVELTKYLRTSDDSPNKFIPIIAITSNVDPQSVQQARDAGVDEYLAKPVSVQGLCDRLVAVVEHPRPFVCAPDFFGPDRRRKTLTVHHDRREKDTDILERPGIFGTVIEI